MKKISQRKTGRAPTTTKTTIDQEEVDAALQLIQLSGDSAGETPKPDNIASPLSDLGAKAVAEEESFGNNTVNGGGGGGNYSSISSSVDDQISSTTIITTTMNDDDDVADNLDDDDDEEAFPSRKRKFRSLADLYLKTKPLFKGRQKKVSRSLNPGKLRWPGGSGERRYFPWSILELSRPVHKYSITQSQL